MNRNNKQNEGNPSIKRQLISIGLYIALAATVLAVTAGSVKNILGGKDSYELPDMSENTGNAFPEYRLPEMIYDPGEYYSESAALPEQKEFSYPENMSDEPVSENPQGVSAEITETEELFENAGAEPGQDGTISENAPVYTDTGKLPEVHARPIDGYISREFSKTELLYTPTMNDFRTHDGIDIAGDPGCAVVSYADGEIADIYDDAMLGKTVVIKHSGGLVTCYGNLSENLPSGIEVGKAVRMGDIIGGIGETAMIESAEVPHVHFEMYIDEMCVDPEEYLG